MIYRIAVKFTIKTTPTIEWDPNYESIKEMIQFLYSNVATLPTTKGGGHHGHIGIIMKPTLYTTLLTTAWTNLPDPGLYPTVTPKSTTAHQYQIQLQHDKGRIIYEDTGTME